MISLTEAREEIAARVVPRSGVTMALDAARGCVLAADVVADGFYPAGDRSQMDGYVVRGDAAPGLFHVVGEVAAGDVPKVALREWEAMRIFTGALLPVNGGRVIPQEEAVRDGDAVRLDSFGVKRFVRAKGSEASSGQVILPQGTVLGAAELAILAQVGVTQPLVVRPPRVRHLATGGELVDPSEIPGLGGIRDTNTTLLRALFSEVGITSFASQRIPDDVEALVQAADTDADILILSGGASVGDYDYGVTVLRRLGYTVHFDRVNLRPGKPLTFATKGGQVAFVLPGNPVSHFVCFHAAVKLAVERAAGLPPSWPSVWIEFGDGAAVSRDPRETWWPARVTATDGRLQVTPLRWESSGHTFSLVGTNALLLVNTSSPSNGRALTLLLAPPGA